MLLMHANAREEIKEASAGDIITLVGMKETITGDTLCDESNPIILESIHVPEPVISIAVEPKTKADIEKMSLGLQALAKEDPSFRVSVDEESGQTILAGVGELHLEILVDRLLREFKVDVNVGEPRIAYRETFRKPVLEEYTHKKQSGGAGQFGEVHMLIEPYYDGMPNQTKYPIRGTETHDLPWGGKLIFNNCIVGGAIDARFMPAILKGIMEKMEEGPLTGSYARDIVVNIYDGKMHPVDSNEMAFKLAGRNAFKDAFKNAGPRILEPIYDVEVFVPSESMGGVMTDLQGRRGIVMGMDSEGKFQKLRAKVPLAEMNKYSTSLSSLTSGRASYGMKFAEYQQVPSDVQSALLKAYEESQTDEDSYYLQIKKAENIFLFFYLYLKDY